MPKTFDELKDTHLTEVDMTLAELQQKVDETTQLLTRIKSLHKAYARKYLAEDRPLAYAQGLVHSQGEADAIDAILTSAEENPAFLTTLASQDGGSDDDTFEVTLLRARFEAVQRIQAAAEQAQALAHLLFDTAASIGQNAKPITQAAYRILKPISATSPKLQTSLAPAIEFQRKLGRGRPKKTT